MTYSDLLSKPLISWSHLMLGNSASTAGIPEMWSAKVDQTQISKLPHRLSDNPDLIPHLAHNFWSFANQAPFPPSPKVRELYMVCTELGHQQQDRYQVQEHVYNEPQITLICNMTLLPLVAKVFDDFVAN